MAKVKIAVIVGSNRRGSINGKLAQAQARSSHVGQGADRGHRGVHQSTQRKPKAAPKSADDILATIERFCRRTPDVRA